MKRSPPRPTIHRPTQPPPPLPPFRNNDEDNWKVDTALAGANAAALALIPALVDASIAESQAVSSSLSMFSFGAVCALIALAYDQTLIAWDRFRGQDLASSPLLLKPLSMGLAGLLVVSLGVACFWPRDLILAGPALVLAFVALISTMLLRYGLAALALRAASFATLTVGVIVTLAAQAVSDTPPMHNPGGVNSVNTIIRYGSFDGSTPEGLPTKPVISPPPKPKDVKPPRQTRPPRSQPPRSVPDKSDVAPLDEGGEMG